MQTGQLDFRLDPGGSVELLSSWSDGAAIPSGGSGREFDQSRTAMTLNFEPARLGALQDDHAGSTSNTAEVIPEPSDWRFDLYTAGWLPLKLKGSVTMRGTATNIDVDLDTLLDDLEWVVEGGFQFTNDEWSIVT